MNQMYPQYPLLTPLTRISTRGGESILANLVNGRWMRLTNTVLNTLGGITAEEIVANLTQTGAAEEDSREFVSTLSEYGFINLGHEPVPERLNLMPFNAYLNVTDHCNLACLDCYYGSKPGLTHGVSTADMFRIVDSLRDGGIANLVVAGGEPLTRPDITELLEYIGTKGFTEVTLLTNGIPVTDENAAVIARTCPTVHVSLDGPDDATNAAIRGKGHFEPAIAGVRKLKAAGVAKIRLVTNINAVSVKRMHEMKQWRDELGVELANNIFTEVGRARQNTFLIPKTRELIEFFLTETNSLNCDASQANTPLLDIHAGVTCGSGTNMVSVDCRGNVYPCHLFHRSDLRIGNLLVDPDLVAMMQQSVVAAQMRSRIVESRECHGCDVEYFCKGGCMAHSVSASGGDLEACHQRDPFCEVHHAVLSAQLWPNG